MASAAMENAVTAIVAMSERRPMAAVRQFFRSSQARQGSPTGPALDLVHSDSGLWTTEQVRERLGLGSTDAVLRLVRDEALPRICLGGRLYRFSPEDVSRWLTDRRQVNV